MKSAAKQLLKRTLASPLGWALAGRQVREPGVIVLMYHRITNGEQTFGGVPVAVFAEQMRWLRDRCLPIWPEELVDRTRASRSSRPPVLVTFDDGFRDYHDLAYPILKRFEIPAVVFLATSLVDASCGLLWTDEVLWAMLTSRKETIELPWASSAAVSLASREQRVALAKSAREYLKQLPNDDRRAACNALIAELAAPPNKERHMLNWDEVRSTSEWTRFGGHTHTHPILSRVSRQEAEYEIATCRDRIAAETGRAPTLFAYPNGRPADFTRETQSILRACGFTLAFSTLEGVATRASDWLAVKRVPAARSGVADLAWFAAGLGL